MQHQVEGRRAAGAGQPVAVDLEQVGGDIDLGKLLDEARQVLPMDGALVAVQQSRPREQVGAGAHRADGGAGAIGAAQPGEQLAVVNPLRAETAAQDDDRTGPPRADGDVGERLVGRDQTAVAGAHRSAALRHDLPAVQLPIRHAIGDAQRLERRGERDHREVGHEHEGEAFRAARQEFDATRRPSLGDGTMHGGALEVLAARCRKSAIRMSMPRRAHGSASFFTRAKSKNDADDQERAQAPTPRTWRGKAPGC